MAQFRSRLDGFGSAKRVWICKTCDCQHIVNKPKQCDICTHAQFLYFASMAEAGRYLELKLMVKGGMISQLEMQPKFPLEIKGVLICNYVADFIYRDQQQLLIVEDVKGTKKQKAWTDVFILKKKMFEAQYGMPLTIIAK